MMAVAEAGTGTGTGMGTRPEAGKGTIMTREGGEKESSGIRHITKEEE